MEIAERRQKSLENEINQCHDEVKHATNEMKRITEEASTAIPRAQAAERKHKAALVELQGYKDRALTVHAIMSAANSAASEVAKVAAQMAAKVNDATVEVEKSVNNSSKGHDEDFEVVVVAPSQVTPAATEAASHTESAIAPKSDAVVEESQPVAVHSKSPEARAKRPSPDSPPRDKRGRRERSRDRTRRDSIKDDAGDDGPSKRSRRDNDRDRD